VSILPVGVPLPELKLHHEGRVGADGRIYALATHQVGGHKHEEHAHPEAEFDDDVDPSPLADVRAGAAQVLSLPLAADDAVG